MSVWYAIPSAAPHDRAGACLTAWREMGYRTAIIYEDDARIRLPADLHVWQSAYRGYGAAVNKLVDAVLRQDHDAQIVVTGGDDVWPDQSRNADEIATAFIEHFGGTLGVMQPTGDPWPAEVIDGRRGIERIAGSPWLGREWCERAYGGNGPLWPEYHHFYVDEELQEVATMLGLFQQRPDLTHEHRHWLRGGPAMRPEHLKHAGASWEPDQRTFLARKAAGFPGHELRP